MASENLEVDLDSIRYRLQGNSTTQKVNALLDAIQYGKEGIELVSLALSDRAREVRQAAFLILSDQSENTNSQLIWNHLPFTQMQCLYTLTQLSSNSRSSQSSGNFLLHFAIADYTNTLVCCWSFDYKHSFVQTWDLTTGVLRKHGDFCTPEFELGKEGRSLVVTYQDFLWEPDTVQLNRTGTEVPFFTSTHAAFTIYLTKQTLVAAGYTTAAAGELEVRN